MFIKCIRCGKGVSSEVPEGTVVRAWVECPECIETDTRTDSKKIGREVAATCLHGLLANGVSSDGRAIRIAIEQADALLAELEKPASDNTEVE